jgi:hypothetical protein
VEEEAAEGGGEVGVVDEEEEAGAVGNHEANSGGWDSSTSSLLDSWVQSAWLRCGLRIRARGVLWGRGCGMWVIGSGVGCGVWVIGSGVGCKMKGLEDGNLRFGVWGVRVMCVGFRQGAGLRVIDHIGCRVKGH